MKSKGHKSSSLSALDLDSESPLNESLDIQSMGFDQNDCNVTMSASPWATSHVRRFWEFGTAALAFLILSPVIAVTAVLVRLSSPGPILFRQVRVGRYGQEFIIYKFRTMYCGCSGPAITVAGDSRITRIGTVLRRYKLDELPQLWNVLRGDMGLVGPRPKLAESIELLMQIRPGITGAASLAFRNEERILARIDPQGLDHFCTTVLIPKKAQLDTNYVRTATFIEDIAILLRTFAACVSPFDARPSSWKSSMGFANKSEVGWSSARDSELRSSVSISND